jgi:hypothetical protein
MTQAPSKSPASLWPKHLAERRWYGWVIATAWSIIFLMGEYGTVLHHYEVAATEPESLGSLIFALVLMAVIFYAIYWFFMMITYYVPEKTQETIKFFLGLFGI